MSDTSKIALALSRFLKIISLIIALISISMIVFEIVDNALNIESFDVFEELNSLWNILILLCVSSILFAVSSLASIICYNEKEIKLAIAKKKKSLIDKGVFK